MITDIVSMKSVLIIVNVTLASYSMMTNMAAQVRAR